MSTDDNAHKDESAPPIDTVVVSLGDDKGCFVAPIVSLCARPFAKTDDCVDLISFDVGTTHLAVARIRYSRGTKRCCIVHAAQMDIYHPWRSLRLDRDFRNTDGSLANRRQRKPTYVEPFDGSSWPPWRQPNDCNASEVTNDDDEQATGDRLIGFHRRLLKEKRVQRDKETSQTHRWVHDVELMPLALHNIDWLHDSDIDRVLVEQQQYDNTKMRCISYCLLDMFQTRRVCSLLLQRDQRAEGCHFPALASHAALEMFPSTMKLSKRVINVLLQSWRVESDASLALTVSQRKEQQREQQQRRADSHEDQQRARAEPTSAGVVDRGSDEVEMERKLKLCRRRRPNRNNNCCSDAGATNTEAFLSAKDHDDLVDHATHGTKKTSAVRVLEHLFAPATDCGTPGHDASVASEIGQHPMAHWLDSQRAEKHNVCDAILQAFAWLIKHEQEPAMQRVRKKRKRAVVSTKGRKKPAMARLESAVDDDTMSPDTKQKHTVLVE